MIDFSAKRVWELIPIFIDVLMTSVNVVDIGADATDDRDNTFWDANINPTTKGSMLPQNKTEIKMISFFTAVERIMQGTKLTLQHVFVQESLA